MSRLRHDQRRRLRLLLGSVFLALLVPAVVLTWLGYRQLRYEAFYLEQSRAADLSRRVDRRALAIFSREDARSFVDFGYLIVGDGNYVQRSPLSVFPVGTELPGLVSYFQVDAQGGFSTPLLPADAADAGVAPSELESRRALQERTLALLADSTPPTPAPAVAKRVATPGAPAEPAGSTGMGASAARLVRQGLADSAPEEARARRSDDDEEEQTAQLEGQRAYARLNAPKAKMDSPLGRVSELQLKESYATAPTTTAPAAPEPERDAEALVAAEEVAESEEAKRETVANQARDVSALRARRLEKNVAPYSSSVEPAVPSLDQVLADERRSTAPSRLTFFESELDPYRFDVLDAEHFVLFRNAWRDGERYVQGAIIERQPFLDELIASSYRETALAVTGSLVVAHQGEVLATYVGQERSGEITRTWMPSAAEITGALLYRSRLTMPLNDVELIFGFRELPELPAASLISWTAIVFLALLGGGFWLLHRLGMSQIALAEQQQDFVSAVSHELKTPLTSIRMYGEMLRAGWVDDAKRREYYDFIFSESERLSRLINNVLQLARFERSDSRLAPRTISVGELADLARSKVASTVEQAGFELVEQHADPALSVRADPDAFVQILINLVDNAIKFSAQAERKVIVFKSGRADRGAVEFAVRDYGPGVPKQQMKRIFRLFYRTERELTRETVGTGIGLALVSELAAAMGGSVDMVNAEPGAVFRVRLPLSNDTDAA